MSRAVKDIDASKFTLSGTTANVLSVVSPTAGNSSTTIEFLLDEPVNADESTIRLSMAAGGMSDDVNQAVPPFSNQQGSNNSSHTAIGASSAQVPTSAPNTIQVVMEGAVRINNTTSDSGVPTGWSLSMPDQSPSPTISSWQISDGTITFTLSESILVNKTVSIAYDGTDSTFKAVLNGDGVPAFNITVVNNSTDLGGVPPGVTPRNLAMILLGHEVTGAEDVTTIVNLIHNTIQRGSINNLVIGDRLVITSV
jgi:hypothetical protein